MRRQRGHVVAIEQHAARGRGLEAGDAVQGGGLAAAGGTEEHDQLAIDDLELHLLDGGVAAEGLGQAVELNAGHQRTGSIRFISAICRCRKKATKAGGNKVIASDAARWDGSGCWNKKPEIAVGKVLAVVPFTRTSA